MAERRVRAIPLVVLVAFIAAGCSSTGEDSAFDAELQRTVEQELGGADRSVAVAIIDGDGDHTAYVGADEGTAFPIMSISKALTGELLAESVERGEVALEDPLGEYLSLGEAPAADVTLLQLATHTSGLPRDVTDPEAVAAYEAAMASGEPFDGGTVEELVAYAADEAVTAPGEPVYSNLGVALLGHALASAADTDYPSLLEDRLLEPLGMEGALAPTSADELPTDHSTGFDWTGERRQEPVDAAYAPASGVYATLPDLVALAHAVIDGELSDSAAIEPVGDGVNGSDRVGFAWELTEVDGRTYLGKDGGGIGSSSTLLIDQEAGRAAIVLVNRPDTVDRTDALRFLELSR